MPYRCPSVFRCRVLDLFAVDLGVSDQTIYVWWKQGLIGTGVESGLSSVEAAELAAAKRRIAEFETELAVTRRASDLLREQVASSEGGSQRSG